MDSNYPGGIVPLASDLSYLNGGSGRYWRDGQWADDSTNQHTNNFNRETVRAEADCNRTLWNQGLRNVEARFEDGVRRDENSRICEAIYEHDRRNSDSQIAQERRTDDKLAALSARVETGFAAIVERELADCKAKNIALEAKLDNRDQTINNFCCPKPAVCVDPCCGGGSGGGNGDTQIILQAIAQQFQAQGQLINSGLKAVAEAIGKIDAKPGNS